MQHAGGHLVVAGEDGGGAGIELQQGLAALDAGFEGVGALEDVAVG